MKEGGKAPWGVRNPPLDEDGAEKGWAPNAERSAPNAWASQTEEIDRALAEDLGDSIHPKVMDHLVRPRNAGHMDDPDGEATCTRECGDGMSIQLRIQGDRIRDLRFMTNGCGAMLACGSAVTELARGRTLREAMALDGEAVMRALEGLPEEEAHCAILSAATLKAAVRSALVNRQEPWKRLYRRKPPI